MGDHGDDGWQTVMPTSHIGLERLARPQLESYERQILAEWEVSRGHWSGIGKHTSVTDFAEAKKLHTRFKPAADRVLGSGACGVVEKVNYVHNNRSVCIARKHVPYRRGRTIQMLREEAHVMEKLTHDHIVRLVGSYSLRQNELYLLMWPVAVCNLDAFFNDLEQLRSDEEDNVEYILKRLDALNLKDLGAVAPRFRSSQPGSLRGNCPLKYLQQIMGCIAHAVAYCHNSNIRHLDLKPSNILLNPGHPLLADFGIAKDVKNRDHTMTYGLQGTPKWRAPEICDPSDEWSMKAADVYSLGLVMLNIATIVYEANIADFDNVMDDLNPKTRAEKLRQYQSRLEKHALATQKVQDAKAQTFGPKHIIDLTSRMLSFKPSTRPAADQVYLELIDLGGIEQIYHSQCCKKSSRFVTERMNTRLKVVAEERDRLSSEQQKIARELEVLQGKDETYETRILNERRAYAEKIANLQEQLDKERQERKRLEALLSERKLRQGIPRPGRSISGTGATGGLTMRVRPQTNSMPNGIGPVNIAQQQLKSPPVQIQSPQPKFASQPSYSQAASGHSAMSGQLSRPEAAPRPTPSPGCPSPSSPAGFPLRSRNSGSRLPRAVQPSTPIRSSTPASLVRDPSLTDSTQFSMASSTFSRISSAPSRDDPPSTIGTPALESPERFKPSTEETTQTKSRSADETLVEATMADVGLGLRFAAQEGGEGDTYEPSVASSTRPSQQPAPSTGPSSPILSSSALSSPRTAKAELDIPGAAVRVPSLPTAKSWADVARKEKR